MALARPHLALAACWLYACQPYPNTDPDYQVGYRGGTVEDDYLDNGERGGVRFTEINWAGSVRGADLESSEYDPEDVFLELQSKMARPVRLTGWHLILRTDTGRGALEDSQERERDYHRTYVLPEAEPGSGPFYTNDYIVIARKRDGAFPNADYYLEDLTLPTTNLLLTLRDRDLRLIDGAGSMNERVFAGGYDLATVRSLERIQLIFANSPIRDASWHAYSLNEGNSLHEGLRQHIAAPFLPFTYATPGMPNSPDYSGNTSSGVFQ